MQKMKSAQIERLTVCIVGSGNWGSTAAKIIGENILGGEASRHFDKEVRMWVFEEDVKQTDEGAHVLVWVLPHQFIPRSATSVKDIVHPKAISISMVKGGVDIATDGVKLCSETIAEIIGHDVS